MKILSDRYAPIAPSLAFVLTVCSLCVPTSSLAESLKITSNPSGATVARWRRLRRTENLESRRAIPDSVSLRIAAPMPLC